MEQHSPFRELDWRAQRAQHLAGATPKPLRASRKFDDDYTKLYRNFLVKWNKGTEADRWKLFTADPALFHTHGYRYHDDEEWKVLLEARILTQEPDDAIASALGVDANTVNYYEKLFFNVRDRLGHRTWIIKKILGPEINRVPNDNSELTDILRHMSYKMFAYFGGPEVLDVVIAGLQDGPIPLTSDKAAEWLDRAIETTTRSRTAMAVRVMRIDKWNVMQLIEAQQRFMQSEKEARLATGGAGQEYEQNVVKFLNQVPLNIGRAAAEQMTPALVEYEKTAVEPTVDEQYDLSRGVVPAGLAARRDYVRPPATELEDAK